jgi:hypothetical protein
VFANRKLIKDLVRKISIVERDTLNALAEGRVEHEPAFTDRLLGAMEYVLNGVTVAGVQWTVKTLTANVRGSQESEFGADFLAALELSVDGFQVAKGFLAQSKLVEPSDTFSSKEASRLKKQCDAMLSHSPASFVFLYSQHSGIVVVPAIEVLGARDCNPHELTGKPMAKFYQDHFDCFIGDRGIRRANPQALEELRERYQARRSVLLSGVGGDEANQLSLFS